MNKKIELVDLVDRNGVVKKQGIPRPDINLYPELYLQIIIGVIFDDLGRILVHKRASMKKVYPGYIDHVCGAVISGETPMQAMIREAVEETGIKPENLEIVTKGVNIYDRYRYLIIGETNKKPGKTDTNEADWVSLIHPDELKDKQKSGEYKFVDEFFEDTKLAINHIKKYRYG